jgi:segregation and condensation protein A
MPFRLDLPIFRGPLDLLLYLVRKHEVEILEIPIQRITEQFLDYVSVLEQIDVNAAGDFLAMASTLVEIKSQQVLPENEEEIEEDLEDPRQELVQQLLAYKRFCDTAGILEERGRLWQRRYPRAANDLPERERNLAEEPIEEVELWDLVSAFGRIIRENTPEPQQQIRYDDTPISTHMQRIYHRLKREEKASFRSLFQPEQHKSTLIGVFLATLELVRHEYAFVYQKVLFGEIELEIRSGSRSLDFSNIEPTSSQTSA